MDTSSLPSTSASFLNIPHNHSMTMRNPTSSTSSSSAQTLYYYNVDAILSELIRPATPKHGNLARPRLVKPEAIRPQQLVGMGSNGSTTTSMHSGRTGRDHHQKSLTTPFALLNDRMEGARNPDPIQQQVISPFAIDDNEEEDNGDIGMMAYSNGVINTMDYYYNSNSSSSKRSRDDEDILYYKKNHSSNKSITTATMTEDTESAALVTPNPIQYYTSTNATTPSSLTLPTTNSWTYEEPQYIVYKNLMDDTKNAVNNGNNESNHENYNYFQHGNNNNNNNVWTTNTPSTSVSYTIVKPIAMRPMDVIQHMDHHYYHYNHPSTPEDDTNNACTLTKNALYPDAILDDGSMQVCG